MDVDSIADLSDEAGKTITGIEPGAGVVSAAENTVATYDNLSDWEVATSSSGAMTVALGQAIKNQEDIVITGWSPHWMFAKYDLKYLDDPEGTMGDAESINTMVRQGLSEDMPEVYDVLDKFSWTQEDMEEVMLAINDGASAEDAAKDWVDNHAEEVAAWTNQ